jgi:hypothetical protein
MKIPVVLMSFAIVGLNASLTQAGRVLPNVPTRMESGTDEVGSLSGIGDNLSLDDLERVISDIPISQLSKIAHHSVSEAIRITRGAKGQEIYRTVSPSAVLVATKEGFGSGSLIDTAGDILTNWHVVRGYEYVGVVFKPTVEGKKPRREEMKRGRVVKSDEDRGSCSCEGVGGSGWKEPSSHWRRQRNCRRHGRSRNWPSYGRGMELYYRRNKSIQTGL